MIKEYIVDSKTKKANIKAYMENALQLSARQAKKLLKNKRVTINGKTAYWDNLLKAEDRIAIDFSEKAAAGIAAENIPINILYEDEAILAVNKPPYMLMHPTRNHEVGTLANALAYYFGANNINAPVRFLNRLDMNTSGVVVVPKSSNAHSLLMQQLENRSTEKKYIAVVEGIVMPECGIISCPIGTDPADPIKRAVIEDGQPAVSEYRTLQQLGGASVLEVRLVTGRTHQIRVHMRHTGHPIIGDELYGSVSSLIPRQALHAFSMKIAHPADGREIRLEAPLPQDMERLIDLLH